MGTHTTSAPTKRSIFLSVFLKDRHICVAFQWELEHTTVQRNWASGLQTRSSQGGMRKRIEACRWMLKEQRFKSNTGTGQRLVCVCVCADEKEEMQLESHQRHRYRFEAAVPPSRCNCCLEARCGLDCSNHPPGRCYLEKRSRRVTAPPGPGLARRSVCLDDS